MSEESAIDRVDRPVTVSSMVEDLRAVGIEGGETLLVHSSLSSIGWVCGGAQAAVEALMEAVTEEGTLVLPAFTGQYSDPSVWQNPPVPDDWVETIREHRPGFRPEVTPTRGMGAIAECFRGHPEVVRSDHPITSFAAWGRDAGAVVADHALDEGLGEDSPLADVYDRDGAVLMLGTDYATNTSLHLAEYRADYPETVEREDTTVYRDGETVRVQFERYQRSTEDFPEVGADFERQAGVREGTVGDADVTLIDQRALVEFAVEWFERTRR